MFLRAFCVIKYYYLGIRRSVRDNSIVHGKIFCG